MTNKKLIISFIILLLISQLNYIYAEEDIRDTNLLNQSTIKKKLLKAHFIDVGQADSTLIQLPNNQNILIDGGNNSDASLIIRYLNNLHIKKIDYLIATHPHEDHIGGLDDIINNFKINKVYMPKVSHTSQSFKDLLLSISNKGLKINAAKAGISLLDDNKLHIKIIAPIKNYYEELNNYSVIAKITFDKTSILFTGDTESEVEKELLDTNYNLEADLLKVAHHGSNSSTTKSFLKKVNPKYAVISVGKNNNYGHPTKSTLRKLQQEDIKVFRTDKQGTIVAISNGKSISFNKKELSTKDSKLIDSPLKITKLDLKKELVIIKNSSNKKLDISNWKLISLRGKQEFIFPKGTVIRPGKNLTIVSGRRAKKAKGQIVWTKKYIWNNQGDFAQLYNSKNQLVSEY
ncbi:MBL fold metallo-hydrolase [Orenia marismortui]|uniref:Beta-lactamase superfamily II metal-dependent hydrolase n=1 Tax=Orenia marismortui TaxID=46469 RepID=A0A4R8GIK8_9FIRM|nr:MBL fold metallo-hydrolase [Orenia marismortui]TDX45520.1 beta-lactamase superfamily II metal-dependent hydrolase [Orenia marismortui]